MAKSIDTYDTFSEASSVADSLRARGFRNVSVVPNGRNGKFESWSVSYDFPDYREKEKPSYPPDSSGSVSSGSSDDYVVGHVKASGLEGVKNKPFNFNFHVPIDGVKFDKINYTVYIDGNKILEKKDAEGEQIVYVDIGKLTDGSHKLRIKGEDNIISTWFFNDNFFFTVKKNKAPTIRVDKNEHGSVKKDFEIQYVVNDDNDPSVDVQIEEDGRVVQYYQKTRTGQWQAHKINIKKFDSGSHEVIIRARDSSGISSKERITFYREKIAPKVSSWKTQIGSVYEDFDIYYTVTDEDSSSVKVSISVDGDVVQRPTYTSLGIRKSFEVNIGKLKLGNHTVTVVAEDDEGNTGELKYYFNKTNSAPTISGYDTNLGAKNTAFTYEYSVDDRENDDLTVIERVNGKVIRTLRNANKKETYTISVTKEQIQEIELNENGTIEIEVSDRNNSTTYRRVTFTRNNAAPTISGYDKDLGDLDKELKVTYEVSDPEKDEIEVTVWLDSEVLQRRKKVRPNIEQEIKISGLDFLKIPFGKHKIKIVAEDENSNTATRTYTFTRTAKKLVVQLANKGIKTDELATKVLISTAGVNLAKGAILKVEACNNSFDEKPTWEDVTKMTQAGRAFNFQNHEKTSEQAGINIRFTVTKGEARGYSYVTAIGGSYE